ncbi:MAG TPA: hypothetical protein VFK94_04600, partial [Patescibacteria group bacterium]|nr:hypothetical protein [Patescibacteria group bacterium]
MLDEKTESQERFLTLATVLPADTTLPFVTLLRHQAEEKTTTFSPQRAFPFALDRRVFFTVFASALTLFILFLLPLESAIVTSRDSAQPEPQHEVEKLADFARSLMREGNTPQEKIAGAQLLALAEQLKDPTMTPQEKQRLIEETKKQLELPLPQILPFQLDLFASKGNQGKGDQGIQAQQNGTQQDKNKNNSDPTQTPRQSAAGHTQQQEQKEQPGSQQGDKKSEQQKPQESGGGIKFNQPKPE